MGRTVKLRGQQKERETIVERWRNLIIMLIPCYVVSYYVNLLSFLMGRWDI